jgi:hypothetical protein
MQGLRRIFVRRGRLPSGVAPAGDDVVSHFIDPRATGRWRAETQFPSFRRSLTRDLTRRRFVVTSLKGNAQHLYENVYCQRGQMENLIKLHKAQLASDRMSCHSATANQVRLALHTAAFWLMHVVRAAIPQTNSLATAEFATIRERLIKVGARVIEHIARIRIQLPTSCPEGALFRAVALGLMPSGP